MGADDPGENHAIRDSARAGLGDAGRDHGRPGRPGLLPHRDGRVLEPEPAGHRASAPPILPSSPDEEPQIPAVERGSRPTVYFLRFEATAGAERLEGSVTGRFVYNALLERTIEVDDLSTLSGKKVTIRYRQRALPWASATSARAEISKHFDALILDREWAPPQHPNTWVFAY